MIIDRLALTPLLIVIRDSAANASSTFLHTYSDAIIGLVGVLLGSLITVFLEKRHIKFEDEKELLDKLDDLLSFTREKLVNPDVFNYFDIACRVDSISVGLMARRKKQLHKRKRIEDINNKLINQYRELSLNEKWEKELTTNSQDESVFREILLALRQTNNEICKEIISL